MAEYVQASGIEVLQVPSELEQMVALYRERKPRRILEIGSWQGGTMHLWLTGSTPAPKKVVAVDLDHQRPELYEEWRKPSTKVHVISGSSLDQEIKDSVITLGPFDWLFIDGDHGDYAVRSDVGLAIACAAPGALMLMHDVARGVQNEGDPAPGVIFAELSESYETWSYIEDPFSGPWAHGIGVVQL